MVDPTSIGERIETRDDLGDDEAGVYSYWMTQDEIAEKEEKKWHKRSLQIIRRYRDERAGSEEMGTTVSRFNILWANVQTLIPTLYGRTPKPDVVRRFLDADPTARLASTLLERCLSYSVDAFDFDECMEAVVEDRLLPGRGVARVLYVPHYGDEIQDDKEPDSDNEEYQDSEEEGVVIDTKGDEGDQGDDKAREVVYEEVLAKYVFWQDYREGPARSWSEVPWVRYRAYLTRDELVARLGKKKGEEVNLDWTPKGSPDTSRGDQPQDIYKKAIVHEYWDKLKKQVIWIAPGTPDMVLDTLDDPLRLPDFFPNPDPLRSTTTNDKRIPVPDYVEYQDQALELDRLTQRIDKLTRALKVSGVYAGEEKQVLQQLVDEGTENRLIPVGDLSAWSDKGGLKGLIEWMPIQQVAETLIQLYNARDRVKEVLYELTGIGDIMRGMTEPDETLGAQELKANFATRRITPQQRKVAKFAKAMFRLMAGVIAEHFSPKTISMITGYPQLQPVPPVPPRPQPPMPQLPVAPQLSLGNGAMAPQPQPAAGPPQPAPGQAGPGVPGAAPQQPPDPAMQAFQQQIAQWQQAMQAAMQVQQQNQQKQQQFDAAVALIKQDGVHGFRIDIEADSTIAPDEQAEKKSRVEFMAQFVPFMQQIIPVAQGNPAMAAMAEEMTLFVVRAFKVARPLEESISKAFAAIAQMQPPQPPQGSGVDSPADLALRAKEITAKSQDTNVKLEIARGHDAVAMAKLGAESHNDAAKMAASEAQARAKHVLDQASLADESQFRQRRAESMQAREASRLT
jgi:hypothetical protein